MPPKDNSTANISVSQDTPFISDESMLVLDTTATPSELNPTGERIHAQLIGNFPQQFKFLPGKGTSLPAAVAHKFLQHEAFRLVDESGSELPYERTPKQPSDLGAGEKLNLADNETIARFDELSNKALLRRVLPLPGGEQFSEKANNRQEIIDFIIEHRRQKAAENKAKERDVGPNDFVPRADFDEVA